MSGSATKPGFILDGWTYEGVTYSVTDSTSAEMAAPRFNITMRAHWGDRQVTVTYRSEMTNTTGDGFITADDGVAAGAVYATPIAGGNEGTVIYNTGEKRKTDPMAVWAIDEYAQRLTAKNGHALNWETGAEVASSPYAVTAVPRDGYHFLHWVDAAGNIISTDASFVVTPGVTGFYEDAVYYAIFTEDDDVHIDYRISNSVAGWIARNSTGEDLAPSTGTARGATVQLLDGYTIAYWQDEHGNRIEGSEGQINFVPPRYNTSNHDPELTGLDIYVAHTYTAVIQTAIDTKFEVVHMLQNPGETSYSEVKRVKDILGPRNATVAVFLYEGLLTLLSTTPLALEQISASLVSFSAPLTLSTVLSYACGTVPPASASTRPATGPS